MILLLTFLVLPSLAEAGLLAGLYQKSELVVVFGLSIQLQRQNRGPMVLTGAV